jgi:Transglutaminase-like superfamily
MARYGLASHVFVCRDEEYIVVLDLRQDRYFTLEAAKTAALRVATPGWPASEPGSAVSSSIVDAVALPLQRRGWLLAESRDSKDATPVQTPAPEAELVEGADFARTAVKIRPGMLFSFVAASIFAKLALRFCRFEQVVNRVARRRARRADANQPLDLERARQLVAAFGRMRVFLFSTRDECLHDSLAVVEFLARYGLYPNWVFGVRARPFEAHCWVQHAGIVFNDSVEQVGAYVPIMVV